MRLFRKKAKPTPAPRSNEQLLLAYENNESITREECRILYELVDDPWDLGSELHYQSYKKLIDVADKYIGWQHIDWIIDYGCGVGTFTKALKDAHPHVKSIGVDFDLARTAAERRFGAGLFDYFYEMDATVTEYELLHDKGLPDLDRGQLCICLINSTFYLFKEQRRRRRTDHLAQLFRKLENMENSGKTSYILANANHTDRSAVEAIDRLGPELVYLSQELRLKSRVNQFNSPLHTRIWTR